MKSKSIHALAVVGSALGGLAVGAVAVGAIAIGALALGSLAIGRVATDRGRIRTLEIDELHIRRLVVDEEARGLQKS